MTIEDLHDKLNELNIKPEQYYLNGIYGAATDDYKIALRIKELFFLKLYYVYYKERGVIASEKIMLDKHEAYSYFLSQFISRKIYERKIDVSVLKDITTDEALTLTDLRDIYEKSMKGDKILADVIVKYFKSR
ncbi:hypothetical protein EOD41_05515 [Mucilaginibacter limnophilus]|uniref:Uncharacterized protein n=1 Tax=Mucilaginibacter limnophilus TaxID=1932778 RepID=A0A3S3THV9_9SPHI|nr:hypothetical protein [Mucilaginibacter limnophilus]RVU01421.1 hypothetical protein EOD41_05515 [Mucilaginibacter limnophilus]